MTISVPPSRAPKREPARISTLSSSGKPVLRASHASGTHLSRVTQRDVAPSWKNQCGDDGYIDFTSGGAADEAQTIVDNPKRLQYKRFVRSMMKLELRHITFQSAQ